MGEDRLRPFWCGTQFIDWENRCCCRCRLYVEDAEHPYEWGLCELHDRLCEACLGDGYVAADLAHAYGWTTNPEFGYPVEPKVCTKLEEAP